MPELVSDQLGAFARQRGLPSEFLRGYGVDICPEDGERPGWITLPYPHMSGLWHNRYRNPGDGQPKYWAKPGSETHLFNPLLLGPNADQVIFTEGEIDCLTLVHMGYPAIGIPGAGIASRFHSSWRLLFDGCLVAVAFDGDQAGRAAAQKLYEAFEPMSRIVELPDDMDINDWYLEDEAALRAAIDGALGSA